MARTSKTASGANEKTVAENENSMDLMDIDDIDDYLFSGGGDDDGIGEGFFDLFNADEMNNMEDLAPPTIDVTADTRNYPRTSKGPPPIELVGGQFAQQKNINSDILSTTSTAASNFTTKKNNKPKKAKKNKKSNATIAAPQSLSNVQMHSGKSNNTTQMKTRGKRKRKDTSYVDNDEVTNSEDGGNRSTKTNRKKTKSANPNPGVLFQNNGVIIGNSNNTAFHSNMPMLPLPLKNKNQPKSAKSFTTGGSSINSGTTSTAPTAGMVTLTHSAKTKIGKNKRSLPTRNRKISNQDVVSSKGSSSGNYNSQNASLSTIIPSASTSSSSNKQQYNNTDYDKNVFFPFSSIPSTYLGGGKKLMSKYPHLQRVVNDSMATTSTLPTKQSKNSKNVNKKQSLLIDLIANLGKARLNQLETNNRMQNKKKAQGSTDQMRRDSNKNNGQHSKIDEHSVALSRKFILTANRQNLITELKLLLQDMHRRSRFMTKSLVNMSSWCNNNLSSPSLLSGSSQTSTSTSTKKHNKSSSSLSNSTSHLKTFSSSMSNLASTSGVLPNLIQNIFNSPHPLPVLSSPNKACSLPIAVKVNCPGLKKQYTDKILESTIPSDCILAIALFNDYSELLRAPLPQATLGKVLKRASSTAHSSGVGVGVGVVDSLPSNKKQKKSNSTQPKVKISTTSNGIQNDSSSKTAKAKTRGKDKEKDKEKEKETKSPIVVHKEKQFETMAPREKLDLLKKILSQRAAAAEAEVYKSDHYKQRAEFQNRDKERHRLVDLNDVHVYMNTSTMWGVMKNLPYWDELSSANVKSALEWYPELSRREMFCSDGVIPSILAEKRSSEKLDKIGTGKDEKEEEEHSKGNKKNDNGLSDSTMELDQDVQVSSRSKKGEDNIKANVDLDVIEKNVKIIPEGMMEVDQDTQVSLRSKKGERSLPGDRMKEDRGIQVSSKSMFDRLQSMLVEEDSDDSDDDKQDVEEEKLGQDEDVSDNIIDLEYGDDDDDNNDNYYDKENYSDNPNGNGGDTEDGAPEHILDVSELSLDERAYIHLRAIHLIDQPLLPSSDPAVIEDELDVIKEKRWSGGMGTSSNKDNDEDVNDHDNDDNLNVYIRRLQFELCNQHHNTNAIASSIQQKVDIEFDKIPYKRKQAEEESSYILKHSQFVAKAKKKKDEAIKLEQKHGNSETWVPW